MNMDQVRKRKKKKGCKNERKIKSERGKVRGKES